MKFQRLRETIPLLITFGAVLVVGVLFFSFSKAEAALEINLADEPTLLVSNDTQVVNEAPVSDDAQADADLPQPPDVVIGIPEETVESEPTIEDLTDSKTLPAVKKSTTSKTNTEYTQTYFQAGDVLELNGNFHNDVIVIGQSITIDGEVDGDVIAAAADITINAPVHGNIRVAAGTVTINNTVGRNVTVFTGNLDITDTGAIKRDVYMQADYVSMNGMVNGELRGGANTVFVAGTIYGDINLDSVNTLNVLPTAYIYGDVLYSTANENLVTIDGQVDGDIVSSTPLVHPEKNESKLTTWFVVRKLVALLGALLVGVVLTLLIPNRTRGIVQQMITSPGRSIAWGVVYVLGTAITVTILLFTIIGIPLSIMGVLLFGVSIYLAKIIVGTAIGRLLLPKTKSLAGPMCVGVTLYYIVMSGLDLLTFPWSWFVTILNIVIILWAAGGGFMNLRSRFHDRSEAKHALATQKPAVRKTTVQKASAVKSPAKKTTQPVKAKLATKPVTSRKARPKTTK